MRGPNSREGRVLRRRPDPRRRRGSAAAGALLHVTNGDATVPGLRGAGLAGTILPWRDVLHEGPVPDVPDDELRRVRAAFLAAGTPPTSARSRVRASATGRSSATATATYVLWFEADLYDQLQLVQILAQLRALEVPPGRITLICIGEHLGVAHFGGLGELSAEQLGRLPAVGVDRDDRRRRSSTRRAPGRRCAPPTRPAWPRSPRTPSRELRFLAEAFDRLSREYPSTRDGLSLTERRILAAVADGRADGRRGVRPRRRARGATVPRRHLVLRPDRGLAEAPTPLLEAEPAGAPVDRHARLRLTRRRPTRSSRAGRPRRPQRRRPLDRRRAPDGARGPVALGRGHRVDRAGRALTAEDTRVAAALIRSRGT